MSSHIVIFEPGAGGHQMEYVRHLLHDLRNRMTARFTLLTTPYAARHANCERLAHDFADSLCVQETREPFPRHFGFRALGRFAEEQWQHAQMAEAGMQKIGWDRIDFVLLPYLETIGLLQLGLRKPAFRGKPWATIAIGTRFHHRACGIKGSFRWIDPIQQLFFRRVLTDPSLVRLGTIDPYLPRAARHPKVMYCVDPCPTPAPIEQARARDAYGLRRETFVVLVFGVIDRRKCLHVLLAGAARVPKDIDLTVFVVGRQAKNDVAAAMRSDAARALRDSNRLVEVDRFILSNQDVDPVMAADAVWVFYEPNFVYSSSVLVRAGRSGRPVIARLRGVVGKQVEENGLGLALESDSPESVASALTRLASDASMCRRMGEAGVRAFADHSPQAFAKPITEAVLATLGSGGTRELTDRHGSENAGT